MHRTSPAAPFERNGDGGDPEETRTYEVDELTRVEGEGRLRLVVRDGRVEAAELRIFESPRYFEKLVVGHRPDEVLDIVARICGICPIAYQLTAVHAFEAALGVDVEDETRVLRRLLYCGEWLQSHALHVYLLHLPDFLGFPSAVALAEHDRATVEQGLRLKRIGNRLIEVLGGRSIHPVSLRVGGFWRTPARDELRALADDLDDAIELALKTVDLVSRLPTPAFEARRLLVSLRHPQDYPLNEGRIVSSDGMSLAPTDWPLAFREVQVAHSTALQARTLTGEAYLLGPTARISLAGDRLHPLAAEALERTGLRSEVEHNVFRSIMARAVELVHVAAEAHDIVDAYVQPRRHAVPWTPRPGIGAWATEAPRGMLFHRYELDEEAVIRAATIVPPTSQNQAAIEADLARFAPSVLDLPRDQVTDRLERLIRCYDPCISCATHFLDLEVVGADAG